MLLLPLAFLLHSLVVLNDAYVALLTDSPWIVTIWHFKVGSEKELRCAGSIISERLVLTSARCLEGQKIPQDVWVTTGAEDLLNASEISWYQSQELRIHPSYSQSGINTWDWRHDVGLLITFREIRYSPIVQPIQTSVALAAPTIEVELQGFGIVYPGWINGRSVLLAKKFKIEHVHICQERSENIYSFLTNLAPPQMCVIDTDQNVKDCPQNVGGPVTSCGLLVGVVSWMSGTCYHAIAGILFTDISWYNDWIYETASQVLGHRRF